MGTENANSQDLSLLLIGALIAFLSANIVEYIKGWFQKREKTKNFKLFTRLELQVVEKTLEKLQTGLSYGNFYDYNLLTRIEESARNMDKVRTDAIHLPNNDLKEKFVDLISDILTFVSQAKTTQDIFYQDQRELKSQQPKKSLKKNRQSATEVNAEGGSAKSLKEMWEEFNRRTLTRTIEYVEIKRRIEELIEKLR